MTEGSQIQVSASIGKVSLKIVECKDMMAMITLAHGAGAGMEHPFMKMLSAELAQHQIGSIRFNFPFSENKKKRPDPPAVAERTVQTVVDWAERAFDVPLFCGGKSFGGRMTSQWMAKERRSFIRGIVFYGFPLHPPGTPSVTRADHLKDVPVPMLFLQGTRDALAQMTLVEQVCNALPLATLEKFQDADHSFTVSKHLIVPDLAQTTRHWVETRLH